jgi:hypothetical protein
MRDENDCWQGTVLKKDSSCKGYFLQRIVQEQDSSRTG